MVHFQLPFLGLGVAGQLSLFPYPPRSVPPQVLFALCSLLRHFPYAQQQFLKLGGLQVLRSLVQEKGTEVLAVRVVTLLYDLVTEKVSAWPLHVSSIHPCMLISKCSEANVPSLSKVCKPREQWARRPEIVWTSPSCNERLFG